jgi:hypothetical protein
MLLLTDGGGKSWQVVGRMPRAGQYGFESPQVARYNATQHFKSHEVGLGNMMSSSYARCSWGAMAGSQGNRATQSQEHCMCYRFAVLQVVTIVHFASRHLVDHSQPGGRCRNRRGVQAIAVLLPVQYSVPVHSCR